MVRSVKLDYFTGAEVVPLNPILVGSGRSSTPADGKISFSTMEGMHIVPVKDVICCTSDNSYCHIYLRNGTSHFIAKTLKTVEEALPAKEFFRSHRSHLVRLEDIVFLSANELQLTNGMKIPVSRQQSAALSARIQSFTRAI